MRLAFLVKELIYYFYYTKKELITVNSNSYLFTMSKTRVALIARCQPEYNFLALVHPS